MLLLALFFISSGVIAFPVSSSHSIPSSPSSLDLSGLYRRSDNDTSEAEEGWVTGPQGRGTWDLLLGCLTTLSLCAWTAYHPNIYPTSSAKNTFLRRLGWMVVAVTVPEFVLYCAWEQRWAAANLRKEINAMGKRVYDGDINTKHQDLLHPPQPRRVATAPAIMEQHDQSSSQQLCPSLYSQEGSIGSHAVVSSNFTPKPPTNETTEEFIPWTLEQAYFAVSGGFAVDSSSFWYMPILTFTPKGVLELAKAGVLPHVSAATVTEKSKADIIAKAIVCIQAGWFFVQCIARLIENLPLTLLEIHILTHVVCAFVMYFLWMDKPYDVASPIICKEERVKDMAALFSIDSNMGQVLLPARDRLLNPISIEEIRAAQASSGSYIPRTWSRRFQLWGRKYGLDIGPAEPLAYLECFEDPSYRSDNSPETNARIAEQHARANNALEYFRSRFNAAVIPGQPPSELQFVFEDAHVVYARSNSKIDGTDHLYPKDPSNRMPTRPWPVFGVVSALYGGAHLSAWATHFPTAVEMWMWRASGMAMASFPLALFALVGFPELSRRLYPPAEQRKDMKLQWLRKACSYFIDGFGFFFMVIVFCVLSGAYPVARLYVLVEAFASLRSPPAGTYDDVKWASFIPHAG